MINRKYIAKNLKLVEGFEVEKEYEVIIEKVFTGKTCIYKDTKHFFDDHAGYKTFMTPEDLLHHFTIRPNAK